MGLLTDPWRTTAPTRDLLPATDLLTASRAQQTQAEVWTPATYPLLQFVQEAWPIVDQRPYVHGWYLEALCDHLSAVYTGEIPRLLINISPRFGKSLITAVLFNAWVWIMDPSYRLLYFSYAMDLAMRDARKCRELIRSQWYQARFGSRVQINPEHDRVLRYATTAGGHRVTSSVGGLATGEGGDIVVGDDLHNVSEERSETRAELEAACDFWFNVVPTRVNDFNNAREIVVGQRVAHDDVSSHILANGTHEALIIPMEYEPPDGDVKPMTSIGWSDPRVDPGELMCPERMNATAWARLKKNTRLNLAAQFQQRPEAERESLFPRSNWRFFERWPQPEWFDIIIQSWDMRFKEAKDSGSYVAGHVWGRKGANAYLLDRFFERASFPDTQQAVKQFSEKWPLAHGKLIENKANGPAIAQSLRTVVPGVILVEPEGSKFARAQAVAYFQHAGNIWLPHPSLAPWVDDYQRYMQRFPAPPDDDCDASTQAWRKLLRFSPAGDPVADRAQQQAALMRQKLHALHQQQGALRVSRTNA